MVAFDMLAARIALALSGKNAEALDAYIKLLKSGSLTPSATA